MKTTFGTVLQWSKDHFQIAPLMVFFGGSQGVEKVGKQVIQEWSVKFCINGWS